MDGHAIAMMSLAATSVACSQVMVEIQPDSFLRRVGDNILGANVVYSHEDDAPWESGDLIDQYKELGISFIRYPGGEVTDYFHWADPNGVGWRDTWAPGGNSSPEPASAWMGYAEYMDRLDSVGGQPLVGVNVDSGHVYNRVEDGIAEAAAFVQHALERGDAVRYWYVGNESYHDISRIPGGMTAAEYGNYINAYANAMRAVDPEIKIVANWKHKWSSSYATLLDIAGQNIDMIDFHGYWNWGNVTWAAWTGKTPLSMNDVFNEKSYLENILDMKARFAARGLGHIELGMLEWNVGPFSSDDPVDWPSRFQISLMNAEILLQCVEAGLDASTIWPARWLGPGSLGNYRSVFEEDQTNPTYHVLRLISPVAGHHVVASSASDKRNPVVAMASPCGEQLTIYVLLKGAVDTEFSVDAGGFSADEISIVSYSAENRDISGNPVLDSRSLEMDPSGLITFTAPAWSFSRLTLKRSEYRMETGTVTASSSGRGDWRGVVFARPFNLPPVVVCGPLSDNGPDPAWVSVRTVTATGFEYRISEWEYLDGRHASNESFNWIAIPEGRHQIGGIVWEAGFLESNHLWWKPHRFKRPFREAPSLFLQIHDNGDTAVVPRIRNIATDRFELRLSEEEMLPDRVTGNDGEHPYAEASYIAVAMGSGILHQTAFHSFSTGPQMVHDWRTVAFQERFESPPWFIASIQTENDSDPAVLRFRSLDEDSLELMVQEENSNLLEGDGSGETTRLAPEAAALLVVGSPDFSTSPPRIGLTSDPDKPLTLTLSASQVIRGRTFILEHAFTPHGAWSPLDSFSPQHDEVGLEHAFAPALNGPADFFRVRLISP
ncbi:hypothetical protein G0Q06_03345 [Puniceicoccales bacterium CK1056]|uniref:Alpha-L-arabinofuranosidase 1 catalytic domain-containing protein n=1 Tax=Oceanipulchritudo coccoides TaxID=2706888 RepID=A0A6B2LZK9_9BACT|nr:hypothetical protein [Oceanipulchritudo coccoides]NDV61479.1 hypothetical protein [Oceanipulchritudo coccoides]